MTRQVISVAPDAPIAEAARLMVDHRISGLPVIDGQGTLKGIITERDLLRNDHGNAPRWLELAISGSPVAEQFSWFHRRTVAEVMKVAPLTVDADAPLEDATNLIEQHDIKRLPVMRDGRVVGIVSRADLIRALSRAIRGKPSDKATRDRLTELERSFWQLRLRS